MGRELSMVRRLERVEKELGYCQIKLEKEQRLELQIGFLRLTERALEESLQRFKSEADGEDLEGNQLCGRALQEVHRCVSIGIEPQEIDRYRARFRISGAVPMLTGELDILRRDIEDLEERLATFGAFHSKQRLLQLERGEALESFESDGSSGLGKLYQRFEQTEGTWNVLTEDLMNFDDAIRYACNARDYLASARGFILTARSHFAISAWRRDGYLLDLFKHSSVGRAKEMVEGADRNLKAAIRELICLEEYTIRPASFEPLLSPYLEALFEDLFRSGKLNATLLLLETRIECVDALRLDLEKARDAVLERQLREEEERVRLFTEMGDERRKLSLTV